MVVRYNPNAWPLSLVLLLILTHNNIIYRFYTKKKNHYTNNLKNLYTCVCVKFTL